MGVDDELQTVVPSTWNQAHEQCCVEHNTLATTVQSVLKRIPDGTEVTWRVPRKSEAVVLLGNSDDHDDDADELSKVAKQIAEYCESKNDRAADEKGQASTSVTSKLTAGIFSLATSLWGGASKSYYGNAESYGDGVDDDDDDYYNPPAEWKQEDDDALRDLNGGDEQGETEDLDSFSANARLVHLDLTYQCIRHLEARIQAMKPDDFDLPLKTLRRFPSNDIESWPLWCRADQSEVAENEAELPDEEILLPHLGDQDLDFIVHVLVHLRRARVVKRSPNQHDIVILFKSDSEDEEEAKKVQSETAIAIFDLESAIHSAESQSQKWSDAVMLCQAKALEFKQQGKKQQAIFQLKRKKLYEGRLDALEPTILNLENAIATLRGAATAKATTLALASTMQTLKTLREADGMSTGAVDELAEDWREDIEHLEESGSALAQTQNVDVSEADLLEDLEQLTVDEQADLADLAAFNKIAVAEEAPAKETEKVDEEPCNGNGEVADGGGDEQITFLEKKQPILAA